MPQKYPIIITVTVLKAVFQGGHGLASCSLPLPVLEENHWGQMVRAFSHMLLKMM